jgi:hypothetical protein
LGTAGEHLYHWSWWFPAVTWQVTEHWLGRPRKLHDEAWNRRTWVQIPALPLNSPELQSNNFCKLYVLLCKFGITDNPWLNDFQFYNGAKAIHISRNFTFQNLILSWTTDRWPSSLSEQWAEALSHSSQLAMWSRR